MQENFTNELIKQIEINLKKAILEALDDKNITNNCKQVITHKVNSKIANMSNRGNRLFAFPQDREIRKITYSPIVSNNDSLSGALIVEHCQKQDIFKYGGPGFPGRENGQLCEYPKGSRIFYKWDSCSYKWRDIYHSIARNNDTGQHWSNKLTHNAAFEPWWGNNNSGGNYLINDRHRNGAEDLWGDPGVRSYMGTFNQISADVMKSIYNFTLNLQSAIEHFERLSDAFNINNDKVQQKAITKDNAYMLPEKSEDTATYQLNAKYFDIVTNKHYSGFSRDISGYKNAQRDSSYHVNRTDIPARIEIVLKKKH